MQTEQLTDQELVSRFRDGDRDSFDILVCRYRDRLLQFVVWVSPEQRESAEDIVQDVFVKVFKGVATFRGEAVFKTWLYSVARLTALDWRRNFFRSMRDKLFVRIDSEDNLMDIPDMTPDQSAMFEKIENAECVRKAVESLPEKLKAVLLLREWEDLSYENIADVLSLPVGTVRSRIFNARARLAISLKERNDESRM
jgi:RNA polymerase sigma-70 factor (ECF subfamily)